MTNRFLLSAVRPVIFALAVATAPTASAQTPGQTDRFAEATAKRLAELQIRDSDVRSIDYKIKRKIDDRAGPDILGANAWIRLNSCTGWLVISMNRSAYIRQVYTRGDCRVEGVAAY